MGSQLIVRLDDKTKKQFQELCRREGKTSSEVVRRLVKALYGAKLKKEI